MLTIRPANLADAQAIQVIYAPYVEKTAITFEYEVPSVQEFENRINKTLETYPYLVAEEDGQVLGYAYASTYYARTAIIGQLNCPSICMKMPVVEVWEVSSMMP